MTFGSEVCAMTTPEGALYSTRFDRWLTNASLMTVVNMLLGKWAYFLIKKPVEEWKEDGEMMWDLVDREKKRIERGEARNSIMDDAYAIAMSEKMPASMSDQHLRSALMSILFAGRGCFFASLLTGSGRVPDFCRLPARFQTTRPPNSSASFPTTSPVDQTSKPRSAKRSWRPTVPAT